jgi:hypothetical protein
MSPAAPIGLSHQADQYWSCNSTLICPVGEVRSYANVVQGTTKGSLYVTDTDAHYQTSVDDYPCQPIVNGKM